MRKHCKILQVSSETISSTNKDLNAKRQTIIISTCFFNLGITWLLGFLLIIPMNEYLKTIIALMFCICSSLQGFFIFLIYVLLSKSRRKQLRYAAEMKIKAMKQAFSFNHNTNKIPNQSMSSIYNQSNETEIYTNAERL